MGYVAANAQRGATMAVRDQEARTMPENVDRATVLRVATLARVRVDEEHVDAIAKQLTRILGYVAVLNEVDTTGVDDATPSVGTRDELRQDQPGSSWSPEKALANASDRQGGFIRVPKVLDQEDA